MADLELTRSSSDRRLFVLEGYGTLRFEGLMSRSAVADADGEQWRFARRGFWGRNMGAKDVTGTVVGLWEPRSVRRGGSLQWAGRQLGPRSE
jgi:hypothetical protein